MIDREKLAAYSGEYGVALTQEQEEQFDSYCRLLLEWNEKMNLTAIRGAGGGFDKAFYRQPGLAEIRGDSPRRRGRRCGHRGRVSGNPLENRPA